MLQKNKNMKEKHDSKKSCQSDGSKHQHATTPTVTSGTIGTEERFFNGGASRKGTMPHVDIVRTNN